MTKQLSGSNDRSSKGQDGPNTDSVYDFLYHDARRIASFLSQFSNFGHLTGVTHTESAQRSKDSAGSLKAEGGLPGIARVGGEVRSDAAAQYEQTGQRVYDPLWTNALTLLDFLDERDLIKRDIGQAQLGQFVLCTGSLSISDLMMMEKTWRLSSVQKLIKAGNKVKSGKNYNALSEIELAFDLLGIMPHTVQARLKEGYINKVWCSLNQDGLTGAVSDITLKHGTEIPGKWSMLGILDAKSKLAFETQPQQPDPDFSEGKEIADKMLRLIAPIARSFLGRPDDHYGMTPLLIFRSIDG